jgi:hypothetical protein
MPALLCSSHANPTAYCMHISYIRERVLAWGDSDSVRDPRTWRRIWGNAARSAFRRQSTRTETGVGRQGKKGMQGEQTARCPSLAPKQNPEALLTDGRWCRAGSEKKAAASSKNPPPPPDCARAYALLSQQNVESIYDPQKCSGCSGDQRSAGALDFCSNPQHGGGTHCASIPYNRPRVLFQTDRPRLYCSITVRP